MDVSLKNKFTFISWSEKDELSPESLKVNSTDVRSLVEVVDEFEKFLKGCGYEFDRLEPIINDNVGFNSFEDNEEEPFMMSEYDDEDDLQ